MALEWLLPAAREAYAHREVASSTWSKVDEKLFGPKTRIAFVGPEGIGKSVLLDHLTGAAAKEGYSPPAKSRKPEPGKLKSQGNRLAITVSPGAGGPKVDTFNDVFGGRHPVDGVVFVAGSGLITLRDEHARQTNIELGYTTIEKWRKLNWKGELDHLIELCATIEASHAESRRPRWLLVVSTKADLYYQEIEKVGAYYSPYGDSEFANILNTLRLNVGRNNFEWDALPVCSMLEDFHWGKEVLQSQLGTDARDHYLAQMTRRLGSFVDERA